MTCIPSSYQFFRYVYSSFSVVIEEVFARPLEVQNKIQEKMCEMQEEASFDDINLILIVHISSFNIFFLFRY